MKVLHLSCAEVYGGIETILVSLARHRTLCPEMQPEFGVNFEGRLADELRQSGAVVHSLGGAWIGRPLSVLRARRHLRAVLEANEFDVAVCHGPRTMVVLGPAVRAARVPLTMWVHGMKPRHHWLRWLLARVPPDFAICCSHHIQHAFRTVFPSTDCQVIYAPVASRAAVLNKVDRAAVRRDFGAEPDTTVIVQAGRMVQLKGHRVLLDALAMLDESTPWQCWIVGGAQSPREVTYVRELESQIRELGLEDRVRLLGQRSDVPRILAAADLYCQPNMRGESFAIVFIEAMLAGLPVVTSGIGGALEAVDDSSGVLVPPNDREALENVLRRFLNEPDFRSRIAHGSVARARQLCDPAARMSELHAALLRFSEAPSIPGQDPSSRQ